MVLDGIRFCYNPGGEYTGFTITTSPNTNGQWHHFAIIKDHNTNTITVYKNGLFQGSDSFTAFTPDNGSPRIATSQETGNRDDPFEGNIEEVKIYNRSYIIRYQKVHIP